MSHPVRMRAQGGFSLLEMLLAVAAAAIVLGGAIEALGGADGMVRDGRARLRAQAEHRRNLVSLTNRLRQADLRQLGGFGADGTSIAPVIRRVRGADLEGRTFATEETIRWLPSDRPVDGVRSPGALYAVTDAGGQSLVADRVPAGGFVCRQEGAVLVVDLRTFYRTREGRTLFESGSAVVQLRNQE